MPLTYEQRQKRWVEENGIVAGSKVRVAFSVPSYFGGWLDEWLPAMDAFVGETVHRVVESGMGMYVSFGGEGDVFWFPYMCLQKVADPAEPKTKKELTDEEKELVISVVNDMLTNLSTKTV